MARVQNVGMVVVMVLAVVVGFIAMGFTAKAASDISAGQDALTDGKNNEDLKEAHKDATIASVLGGIVSFLILIALLIYLLRKEASGVAQSAMTGLQGQLGDAHQWVGTQQFGR
jgi:hypothetical protein